MHAQHWVRMGEWAYSGNNSGKALKFVPHHISNAHTATVRICMKYWLVFGILYCCTQVYVYIWLTVTIEFPAKPQTSWHRSLFCE